MAQFAHAWQTYLDQLREQNRQVRYAYLSVSIRLFLLSFPPSLPPFLLSCLLGRPCDVLFSHVTTPHFTGRWQNERLYSSNLMPGFDRARRECCSLVPCTPPPPPTLQCCSRLVVIDLVLLSVLCLAFFLCQDALCFLFRQFFFLFFSLFCFCAVFCLIFILFSRLYSLFSLFFVFFAGRSACP